MPLTKNKIENSFPLIDSANVDITSLDEGMEKETGANPLLRLVVPVLECTGRSLLLGINTRILKFTADHLIGERKH